MYPGTYVLLYALELHATDYQSTACPKQMDSDIFAITQDRKDQENCDLYHYVGK